MEIFRRWYLYDFLNIAPSSPIDHPAASVIEEAVSKQTFSVIQGPPGTGKSTAIDKAIMDLLDTGALILYVAPTNQLVRSRAEKIISYLKNENYNKNEILKIMRVYGSAFIYINAEQFRKPIDDNVKIVLATEYQRTYINTGDEKRDVIVIVDEASKSPISRPFIPLARSVINGDANVTSLNVIGDPQQAISKEAGMTSEELLFTFMVKEGLSKMKIDVKGLSTDEILDKVRKEVKPDWFKFLNTTYRMPRISEEPISEGYYGGDLKSAIDLEDRLKRYVDLDKLKRIRDKVSAGTINFPYFKDVLDAIETALTSKQPIIYLHTSKLSYQSQQDAPFLRVDKERAKISVYAGVILTNITMGNAGKVYIQTAYTDQKTYTIYLVDQVYQRLPNEFKDDFRYKLQVSTAHERIGDESLFTINALGKEWYGTAGTIYYKEPEILNVANTRHQGINIIIGNLEKLRKDSAEQDRKQRITKFRKLIKFSEKINQLSEDEKILRVNIK